jgi:integrase
MARAWLFQDHRQKSKLGDKCPWSVGWIDPEGKRKSKRIGSNSAALKFARRKEGELAAGTYQDESRKRWADFRKEYESKVVELKSPGTKRVFVEALNSFERLCSPVFVRSVTTRTIDEFVSLRCKEPGLKKGDLVSPATVNKDLRILRAAMRKARKWKYIPEVPDFEFVREPVKLIRYVTPEHFAAIYKACDHATFPQIANVSPADWWRALLTTCYMTGWRIGEVLALRREDVDFDKGTAITRHDDNKGKRDELVPLHPVVVDQLKRVVGFGLVVLSWPHRRELLWEEFTRIQGAAIVKDQKGNEVPLKLPCRGTHEHTERCHVYGFHDLRRAFATLNAERMTADALQHLMRHKSYATTQRYVNMARQLDSAVATLHVPDVLQSATA